MKKLFVVLLAALLILVSCEEAGKVNYDALEMIEWKGNFSEEPANPKAGWMYYNTIEDVTYLFDGSSWKIVSKDTQRLSITIDGEELNGTYRFPFDGEIVATKTVTITNTGTIDVFFDEKGPEIKSDENTLCSKAEIIAPSWKSCLKPKESQSFTVRFTRDKDSQFDRAYVEILDADGNNINGLLFESDNYQDIHKQLIHVYYRLYYSEYSYSWESYSSYPNASSINFKTVTSNQKGMVAKIEIGNNTENVIDIPEGSLFWIDGENAEDFTTDMTELPHIKIYPKKTIYLYIYFTPKSVGEKNAVLHISQGDASDKTIDINLTGKCVEKPFDEGGCLFLNSAEYDANQSYSVIMASNNDTEGFFVFREDSIRKFDKEGMFVGDYKVPVNSSSYYSFCYKEGKFYFYTTGYNYSEFRYSTYDPENETFIEEIPCTKEEFEEATGKVVYPQQSQILRYKDIELLFEEKNPNQISIRKDGDLLGVVIGKDGFVWNHNCCVSGDYLYWTNDSFVKRIDIKEILEDLEL